MYYLTLSCLSDLELPLSFDILVAVGIFQDYMFVDLSSPEIMIGYFILIMHLLSVVHLESLFSHIALVLPQLFSIHLSYDHMEQYLLMLSSFKIIQ
jgi:hypothetical protein